MYAFSDSISLEHLKIEATSQYYSMNQDHILTIRLCRLQFRKKNVSIISAVQNEHHIICTCSHIHFIMSDHKIAMFPTVTEF